MKHLLCLCIVLTLSSCTDLSPSPVGQILPTSAATPQPTVESISPLPNTATPQPSVTRIRPTRGPIVTLQPEVQRVPITTPTVTPTYLSIYPSPLPYATDGTLIPSCDWSQLELSVGNAGAMKSRLIHVWLKNTSQTTCIIKEPVYLSIRDRQDQLLPIINNGIGAILEELLEPEGRAAISFWWSGCIDVADRYFKLYGSGINQEAFQIYEGNGPTCSEDDLTRISGIGTSRLTDFYPIWIGVIEVTPTIP